MVVFKMRDSVPIPRYSPVCNVLRQSKTSLIPTYRVYRLYDITKTLRSEVTAHSSTSSCAYPHINKTEHTFKNEQRSRDAAAKKELLQVE